MVTAPHQGHPPPPQQQTGSASVTTTDKGDPVRALHLYEKNKEEDFKAYITAHPHVVHETWPHDGGRLLHRGECKGWEGGWDMFGPRHGF